MTNPRKNRIIAAMARHADATDDERAELWHSRERNAATRRPPRIAKPDSEYAEQGRLCDWLDSCGIVYWAVPNGGRRTYAQAARSRRVGERAGVPDLTIATLAANGRPTALEMKSAKGRLSPLQKDWCRRLELAGWNVVVGRGAVDAVEQLTALGYGL